MVLIYELVDGAACAALAGQILREAWVLPAISYTTDYLAWQLSFPGPGHLRSVLASDGTEPVGFAGATWRRVRSGTTTLDIALVSFVAVRPSWRGRGIAAELYRHLLGFLRGTGAPVVTFAIADSTGEAVLLRSYALAGFKRRALGSYPKYACLVRGNAGAESPGVPSPQEVLSEVVSNCAPDSGILWSDPAPDQILHYLRDPRPRILLPLTKTKGGHQGAAWAIQLEISTASGNDSVTTIDSVWLPRAGNAAALQNIAAKAAAWDPRPNNVISFPSLYGFEGTDLRKIGIRQTGAPFNGYYFESASPCLPDTFRRTSLEIV